MFLLFGVVLFVIVVVCGGKDIHLGHFNALVSTVAAFELCFTNPKVMLSFF